jgi:hypothetical protein
MTQEPLDSAELRTQVGHLLQQHHSGLPLGFNAGGLLALLEQLYNNQALRDAVIALFQQFLPKPAPMPIPATAKPVAPSPAANLGVSASHPSVGQTDGAEPGPMLPTTPKPAGP